MKLPARSAALRAVDVEDVPDAPPLLLGTSPVIERLRVDIQSAARCEAKVLIIGETGVGKEIVARLIHHEGVRRAHPFLAINCAGLPDSLLESELFGHVKGSFTDACRDKTGLAALADHGTLFLDELGEMSHRMQGMLLRFLETGEIHRIGSDRIEHRVNVRVVGATNRNLSELKANGHFREDLYYRLNVAQVVVPPLRERGSDILLLFNHYFDHYCGKQNISTPRLSPATEALLVGYRWPGNVRELRNVAERVAVRHPDIPVQPDMLPGEIRATPASSLQTAAVDPQAGRSAADAAWIEITVKGNNFWTAVQAPFMERNLTKADVRDIIRRGLTETEGSYRRLTGFFHLPSSDYKRLLSFLYQHDCHLPYRPFRTTGFTSILRSEVPAER